MTDFPLAYLITFGTYGMRLHGDTRGTIDRDHNIPHTPVLPANEAWATFERDQLVTSPVLLSLGQRRHVEAVSPSLCERGRWRFHVVSCAPDHVHVLLSAAAEGKAVRRWFKTWLSQSLNEPWPRPPEQSWWAEGGSVRWVWDEEQFGRAFEYVRRQKTDLAGT